MRNNFEDICIFDEWRMRSSLQLKSKHTKTHGEHTLQLNEALANDTDIGSNPTLKERKDKKGNFKRIDFSLVRPETTSCACAFDARPH